MSISTRRGDDGTTSLAYGRRVSKTDPRVTAYGSVDELSAVIGVARASAQKADLRELLHSFQVDLLRLGAWLAVAHEDLEKAHAKSKTTPIGEDDVIRLDALVNELEARTGSFEGFVQPGETLFSAQLHHARTVCRRAERAIVAMNEAGFPCRREPLHYMNRLSDLLWLLAEQDAGAKNAD